MNYIFISPNYPAGHRRYVEALRQTGHNVLGIGDAGDETFPAELRGNLTGYQRVGDLHDYDGVYRACAGYISRFGRIDKIESLNPYWDDLCEALRSEFCAAPDGPETQFSRLAKRAAGVSCLTPRIISSSPRKVCDFAALYGYPLLATPTGNKRLGGRTVVSDAGVKALLRGSTKDEYTFAVLPEGERVSVDGLVLDGKPVVCGCHLLSENRQWVMCVDCDELSARCARAVEEYGMTEGFFHIEAVRLAAAVKNVGKKGSVAFVGFSPTPPHEYIIDCLDTEFDCDLRKSWAAKTLCQRKHPVFSALCESEGGAAMLIPAKPKKAADCCGQPPLSEDAKAPADPPGELGEAEREPETAGNGTFERRCYAAVACRSFERSYKNRHEKILRKLGDRLALHERTAEPDKYGWLDYVYIFSSDSPAAQKNCIKFITDDFSGKSEQK